MTWTDYRSNPNLGDVYGRLLAKDLTPLGDADIAIATGAASQKSSAVVAIAPGIFQVAWEEVDTFTSSIRGALVGPDGVRDPSGVLLVPEDGDAHHPSLTRGAGSDVLLAYDRYDPAEGAYRARARVIGVGASTGAACTTNLDCESRFCADGFCCNVACADACETCSATPGTCTSVTNAVDADTCAPTCLAGATSCQATSQCNASGVCTLTDGALATSGAACLSGFISDGVCCDSACDAGCGTCTSPSHPGTCTPLVAGDPGINSMCTLASGSGVLCDGQSLACPATCASDVDCPSGEFCSASGACLAHVMQRGSCNLRTDCRTEGCRECADTDSCAAQSCSDGVIVTAVPSVDAGSTAGTCVPMVNLGTQSCEGFGCDGNACKTTCTGNTDCASGFSCDAQLGTCVAAAVCADGHTAQDVDGHETDCSPYICSAGACVTACASIADCVGGYACTSNGMCATAIVQVAAPAAGCSCDVASRRDGSFGAIAAGIAIGLASRRRRRTTRSGAARASRLRPRTRRTSNPR